MEDELDGLEYAFERFDEEFQIRYYNRGHWDEFDNREDRFAGYLVSKESGECRQLWKENDRVQAYNAAMDTVDQLNGLYEAEEVWEALDPYYEDSDNEATIGESDE